MVKSDAGLDMDRLVAEKHRLNELLTKFSAEMFHRLTAKLMEGHTGWDDPANRERIYTTLLAHASGIPLAQGQEADIANFAMFLWFLRVQPTLPADAAAAGAEAFVSITDEGMRLLDGVGGEDMPGIKAA